MLAFVDTSAYTTVIPTYAIITFAVWGAFVIAIHAYLYVYYVKKKPVEENRARERRAGGQGRPSAA